MRHSPRQPHRQLTSPPDATAIYGCGSLDPFAASRSPRGRSRPPHSRQLPPLQMNRHPIVAGLLGLLCGAAVACSDTVAPRTISVAVNAAILDNFTETVGDDTRVTCDVLFTARAGGSGGMAASWESGMIEILGGPNQNITAGYINVSAQQLQNLWRTPEITVGDSVQARVLISHTESFRGRGVFRYLPEGASSADTARFNFLCEGEPIEPEAVIWLNVTGVSNTGGVIDAGDMLSVSYEAGGTEGIVETEIYLSSDGATVLTRIDERASSPPGPARMRSRTIQLPVTADHPVGARLRVRIVTTGGTGEQAISEWIEGPIIVDETAPTVFSICLGGGLASRCVQPGEEPVYTPGDTIRVTVAGWDNHNLEQFVWRVGGMADSIAINPRPLQVHEVAIPVPGTGAAAISGSFYFRDETGNAGMSVVYPIRIVPRRETDRSTVLLPELFHRGVVDQAGKTLYLSSESGAVAALSLESLGQVWRTEPGGVPRDLDLAPDERSIAVALHDANAVVILDALDDGEVVSTVPLGANFRPQALSYTGPNSILAAGPVGPLIRVSPDGAVLSRPTVPRAYVAPMSIFRSADYSTVFLQETGSCALVYTSAADHLSACRNLEGAPRLASRDGSRLTNGSAVLDATLSEIRSIRLPVRVDLSAISRDGTMVIMRHPRGLLVADAETGDVDHLLVPEIEFDSCLHAGDDRIVVIGSESVGGAMRTRVTVVDLE